VAGANVNENGETFIKLGWNPIYLEEATPFKNEMPNWGVKIECDGEGCNGLPCAIDPAKNKVNEMIGSSSDGAGGGAFCVVTVPKGVHANFVVFDESGGSGHKGEEGGEGEEGQYDAPAPIAEPSSGPDPSSTYEHTAPSSTSPSWSDSYSSADYIASSVDASRPDSAPTPIYSPHEFFENSTATYAAKSASVNPSTSQTSPIGSKTTGGASTAQLSIASLVMSLLVIFMAVAFPS
jgi:hypothetical protein